MAFDLDTLRSELVRLPVLHRVAFCASCCQRMLLNYEKPHYVVGLVPRSTVGLWMNWAEAVVLRDQICAAVEFPDDAKAILPRPVFRTAFEAMRRLSGTVVVER